ncbi:MAG: YggS family pyridoxal phosphate-dependent enzyme [Flammeovirgaceae bacterium]|nr:YggS family pyridoxal phosphate-dependent enzyme [Flammeovirgaceae bacterium]MDW8287621.1 YggS family pyridoxal phosphate-dependent enzyme [Flammeovirgaceae bacterium]
MLKENIEKIRKQLEGTSCKLVAVTKTHPVELLMEAYQLGLKVFGENKVQEMVDKAEKLPKDIEWHLIGHLQTNKVKYIAPFVSLIHSVDSLKLLQEINKRAQQNNRIQDCLLQVFIAQEETKFGLSEEELYQLLESDILPTLQNVRIKGLMGMATNTDNQAQIRQEFRRLKQIFDKVKATYTGKNLEIKELSMGMSSDYPIALEEGSTIIRVGSAIFGHRSYQK